MIKSKCCLFGVIFSLSLGLSASGMSGTLSFTHDDIFLGNIDHNAIGLSLTAYVEFSENDLIDNEFTGCTYGDSAYAWTYLHFHEPISRMTCDQSGYHIPGYPVPFRG